MRYLIYILYALCLLSIGVSCEHNPANYPVNYKEMVKPENTGGFARVVNTEGTEWNIDSLNNEKITITLEVDDAKNGGQLISLEFYLGFVDSPIGNIGDIEPDSSKIFRAIDSQEFSQSEESNGLPRVTTTFTSSELIDQLNIDSEEIEANASFALRWQINLDNGKTFGPGNTGPRVNGSTFYSSPFAQNIRVIDN